MKTQIEHVLSRNDWEGIVINENNEPLVELQKIPGLIKGTGFGVNSPIFFVRRTIADKLYRIGNYLSSQLDLQLVVIEGYRTLESQQKSWDREWLKVKQSNSALSDDDIEKIVRLLVAKPTQLANHHCGGAVDVTLARKDGTLLDMGTPYLNIASKEDRVNHPMLSKGITELQQKNREILRETMRREQFVWYPGEWWHFCWGDRMWAVYLKQSSCIYGSIEL
ncbi:MAG TPA: M15 family metallopeptidase [Candidatus Paceibacterota bacterium]